MYRYAGNAALTRVDASGLAPPYDNKLEIIPGWLGVKLAKPDIGAFQWPIIWQLAKPAGGRGGVIVQSIDADIRPRPKSSKKPHFVPYYEFWDVSPGDDGPYDWYLNFWDNPIGDSGIPPSLATWMQLAWFGYYIGGGFDDLFWSSQDSNKIGRYEIIGDAWYIDCVRVKDIVRLLTGVQPVGPGVAKGATNLVSTEKTPKSTAMLRNLEANPHTDEIRHMVKIVVNDAGTRVETKTTTPKTAFFDLSNGTPPLF